MITIKASIMGGEILPSIISFPYLPEVGLDKAIEKVMFLVQLLNPDAKFKMYSENVMICTMDKTMIRFEFTNNLTAFQPNNSENLAFTLDNEKSRY